MVILSFLMGESQELTENFIKGLKIKTHYNFYNNEIYNGLLSPRCREIFLLLRMNFLSTFFYSKLGDYGLNTFFYK